MDLHNSHEGKIECSVCFEWKNPDEFNPVSKSRPYPRKTCRECEKKQKKLWHEEHKSLIEHPADKSLRLTRERAAKAALKHEVIVAYGGKCACCGEDNELLLTIDHINNDGKQHREELGTRPETESRTLYRWLRRNHFPKDNFQCLCYNCNLGKAYYGVCPHQMEKGKAAGSKDEILPRVPQGLWTADMPSILRGDDDGAA